MSHEPQFGYRSKVADPNMQLDFGNKSEVFQNPRFSYGFWGGEKMFM